MFWHQLCPHGCVRCEFGVQLSPGSGGYRPSDALRNPASYCGLYSCSPIPAEKSFRGCQTLVGWGLMGHRRWKQSLQCTLALLYSHPNALHGLRRLWLGWGYVGRGPGGPQDSSAENELSLCWNPPPWQGGAWQPRWDIPFPRWKVSIF